jgi:hypothetical protein
MEPAFDPVSGMRLNAGVPVRTELQRANADLASEAGARRILENHPVMRCCRWARRAVRLAR